MADSPYGLGINAGWKWCNENRNDEGPENPFQAGSKEHDEWDKGWVTALGDWEAWWESCD